MATEGVENVCRTSEVKNKLCRSGMLDSFHLTVDEGGDGEVPSRVGSHYQAEERPDSVVVVGGDEHCCCAACSEDIRPGSLVQLVVDVVYVACAGNELDYRSE